MSLMKLLSPMIAAARGTGTGTGTGPAAETGEHENCEPPAQEFTLAGPSLNLRGSSEYWVVRRRIKEVRRECALRIAQDRAATDPDYVGQWLSFPEQRDVPVPPPGKLALIYHYSLLPQPSPEVHAQLFLEWLWGHEFMRGKVVLAEELERLYRHWCGALGWVDREWALVAKHLAPKMGGRRKYMRFDGHKRRVYEIPALSPSPAT